MSFEVMKQEVLGSGGQLPVCYGCFQGLGVESENLPHHPSKVCRPRLQGAFADQKKSRYTFMITEKETEKKDTIY